MILVEFPNRCNGTLDFRGQNLRVHISTPLMDAKKISADFEMGGPPIYESFVRILVSTADQKIGTANQTSE